MAGHVAPVRQAVGKFIAEEAEAQSAQGSICIARREASIEDFRSIWAPTSVRAFAVSSQ
jgi:hypothetical protein